ncbi:MAG: biopolymer transporter ExbD [Verrucomicrobiales bacterium]|nr:biopolymer transporter ExbD [Verrucomicrobiales bacterium]
MKKCSQASYEAVSDLNIVPLLNLAFVLLVIFIVTTTPLINDLDVNLPSASKRQKDPPPKANFITVESGGAIYLNNQAVPLAELQPALVGLRLADPDINVIVRGDGLARYGQIRAVLDACQQANVVKVELATEPRTK